MNRSLTVSSLALAALCIFFTARAADHSRVIQLPTSKNLTLPVPGYLTRTNSFPATIAVSPDGRYAALLNMGYGTLESGGRQSIAILDLGNNHLRDFPDDRLSEDAHQSYFIGLAFSSEGYDCNLSSRAERIASEAADSRSREPALSLPKGTLCFHLYASVGSITDPAGEKPGDLGNGIAVYKFAEGQITPERFIKIPPQRLAPGKEVPLALRKTPPGMAIPYPAGFAVLPGAKPEVERRASSPVTNRNLGPRVPVFSAAEGSPPVPSTGDRLLVANNLSDNVVLLDVNSGKILKSFDLSRNPYVPAAYPYTVIANKPGTKAWCSLWNSYDIAELDLETGALARWIPLQKATDPVAPGPHPATMLLSPNEETLYVALANADIVTAVDLKLGAIAHRYHVGSSGSVPQGIILSADGKRLYAASASLDAIAVFETKNVPAPAASHDSLAPMEEPLGLIPTEWYATTLAVAGNDFLIATAKGEGSGPNNMKPTLQNAQHPREHPYIPTLIGGSIQRLSLADIDKNLAAYTKQVEQDNLLHADPGKFTFAGGKNPIRHVLYILKENRTYDQILGDLPVGDGDASLTMYGAAITPNEHKLTLQFGVLDNFYDSGEVSGDGHLWSTAATTSDYNEKNWPIGYRNRERTYDADGTVADELPLDHGIPDIDDPGTGFLWDNLARHGLTYRIYGEFIHAVWCKNKKASSPQEGTPSAFSTTCPVSEVRKGEALPSNVGNPRGGPSPWPWAIPLFKGMRPSKAALRDHYDPLYADFETSYPDQLRADEFLREFDEFVKARGTASGLPQFILLWLPNDHTGGTWPGKPTPQASVADNDLAVGRVVEAVSHSPYWDDTAIFVMEDDAQSGADHVDAHRSTAFVISKYGPRAEKPIVDHNFYTTVSMIHTMEELLGLPPMNLFDAHAPLMTELFSGPGIQPPYTADDKNLRSGLLYQINPKTGPGAKESLHMDFSRPDAADATKLNTILWRNAKGTAPMPNPKYKNAP